MYAFLEGSFMGEDQSPLAYVGYGFATQEHVAIDIFASRMPERTQAWLAIVAALLAFCFLAGAAWFGAQQMLREYGYGDRSSPSASRWTGTGFHWWAAWRLRPSRIFG
ncbi:hypothetical protein P775_01350 [Puniceibacterium antarcticum]|uniref:TRAP transporter small permease protein n=2 Tax=Puniceibacterium antarcticum TaxID=1206336 RepID=A0A2G8RK83_9RHOB|nr:hypothetical protein P775_01350 [Puniceibacterium antarcticum]